MFLPVTLTSPVLQSLSKKVLAAAKVDPAKRVSDLDNDKNYIVIANSDAETIKEQIETCINDINKIAKLINFIVSSSR